MEPRNVPNITALRAARHERLRLEHAVIELTKSLDRSSEPVRQALANALARLPERNDK